MATKLTNILENYNSVQNKKAVAKWLVKNTILTFEQISVFLSLDILEIRSIADGFMASTIIPVNPITEGYVTRDEITRCEQDQKSVPSKLPNIIEKFNIKAKKSSYTPISRRSKKPDAVFWLLQNHPSIPDVKIAKFVGVTKGTFDKIKKGNYKDMQSLNPKDPVTLGICTQTEFDNFLLKFNQAK